MADSALTILLKMVDKVSKPMGKVAKSLGKVGDAATKAGKSLTKNLTFPILALGAASFKVFSDFETGMSNVSTLVDTTSEDMKAMGKAVQDIGARTPVALGELSAALFDIRSAGIPASDAMMVLESSAQLGAAGLGNTAQAARLAAGAINAWGLEGKEAERVYDIIFKTTKNGITTIAGLEQGFGKVAGVIAKAGIPLDDYLASIAALTTTTLPAAQAHTQMRAAVEGLEKSTKGTRKIFKQLGVKDFRELVKESGGVVQAFQLIEGKLGTASGAMKALVGTSEGAAAILALLGSQGDKQRDTLVDMRKETEGLADVQVAANKQFSTSASKIKIMKNKMIVAGIKIGSILMPAILTLTEKLSEAVEWFDNLSDGTKEMIVTVAGVVAVVGPTILIFGKLVTAISAIATVIKVVGLALTTNPIGLILSGIALVALTIAANWDTLGPVFETIWSGITSIFQKASNFILKIIENIMKGVDRVIRAASTIKAHFAAKSTPAELEAQVKENERIMAEFREQTGSTAQGPAGFGLSQNTLSGPAAAAFKRRAEQAAGGIGPAGPGAQENKITVVVEDDRIKVKSVVGPAKIDVLTGHQGTI